MTEPEIRSLDTLEEYRACVRLQEETWGDGFSEKVPVAILMVSRRLGGVVAGAFGEAGEMLGFVFGMTGWEDGIPVHWSDMLAVRPEARGRGLGGRLKRYQREQLLSRGVHLARWTFDPLESGNAVLNLAKLGAVAREYVPDMYGATGSRLHGELPTDRLVVTWFLDSSRVRERLAARSSVPRWEELRSVPRAFPVTEVGGNPVPGEFRGIPPGPRALVSIPAYFEPIRAGVPALARRWQEAVRSALIELLDRGYEARELVREGTLSHYLLVRQDVDDPASTREEGEGGRA